MAQQRSLRGVKEKVAAITAEQAGAIPPSAGTMGPPGALSGSGLRTLPAGSVGGDDGQMKGWFVCHSDADRIALDDELPGRARLPTATGRSCCCPAPPAVTVVMFRAQGRPHPVDLLLCGHHYRASRAALHAAEAAVYDAAGALIMSGADEQRPACCEPVTAAAGQPRPLHRKEPPPNSALHDRQADPPER